MSMCYKRCEVDYVRVQWIEFENMETGLKIERIDFYKDITLLVGLSGAGKTQILSAVAYSLNLAVSSDMMLKPCRVSMGIVVDESEYEWSYEINCSEDDGMILTDRKNYSFVYERLTCDDEMLFERDGSTLKIAGYGKVPQPRKDESLLSQYSEDEKFKHLITGIKKMYSVEIELDIRGYLRSESFSQYKSNIADRIEKEKAQFENFSHLPVVVKLFIAKKYYPDIYIKIFDAVKELFMEVEDIDIVEDTVREIYMVAIKVYGKQLLQYDISNGMLKTIYYIVELFTMSKNSLVLIDEFENGLGVNCIDLLSEMMLFERKDLQFIITSHHPKIIGGIDSNKWKIIDREGSVVKNINSESYGIGNSRHDAYFNLINKWEYEGKI